MSKQGNFVAESTFRFRDETLADLSGIEGVSLIIPRLEELCSLFIKAKSPQPRGETKEELLVLSRALITLEERMSRLSTDAILEIVEQSKRESEDLSAGATLAAKLISGSGVFDLRRQIVRYSAVAFDAGSNIRPQKGRRLKGRERKFAFFVGFEFINYQLPLSAYVDSPYMQVLNILFKEVMPTKHGEAYRRYGDWAVKALTKD